MNEMKLKTKLTPAEKFATVGGITLFGICLSSLIGRNPLAQVALTGLILFLITAKRPSIVYAFVVKFRRDVM
jgi:hypothetical protein